ncbi:MAG: 23S rRNA (pseudouridine(1915)-N(3))-methyltransferase RlmH [Bacteriovoracaceae bacterium]|jgi:23S rRNA (pseudouridine1915-N3)-methyltransferase|nr:23S rRNA (pseudouridine(1915)-N(3))-methyltransferase RlmH [Bacteriovoracaceae bacterium]
MKEVHLIVVGKLKEKNILELENDYLKRVKNFSVYIHEVKSGNDDVNQEGLLVEKKIYSLKKSDPKVYLLSEWGEIQTSQEFSNRLYLCFENSDQVFFLIGGAAGHAQNILSLNHEKISMGKMTYPHKLARLLFVEQLYRAETIRLGHPYHK